MKMLPISNPPPNFPDMEKVALEKKQGVIPRAQQKVSSALDEVLTYPNPPD